ncbi:MAG: Wzz/FepE/Etk N-terminal domain-containing protein, partial [Fidelibacterota bacterium]
MKFAELQDIMHSRGITTLAEIARELGVSPQAVSNWKARDRVPYRIVVKLQEKGEGRSAEGEGLFRSPVSRLRSPVSDKGSPVSGSEGPEESLQIVKDDEIDLRALWKVIWSGRRFIAVVTGAFTLVGIIYALLATPYYKSTITVYPAAGEEGRIPGQLQGLASSFGVSVGGSETSYNIPDVVRSRRIRKMILTQEWETK